MKIMGTQKIRKIFKVVSIFLIFSVLLSISSCLKDKSTEPTLEEIYTIASQMDNLQSLIIVQNDEIIKEEYYGAGGPDILHDVRSVTKSVSSLLIGIAIDKGYLSSLDQTLGEFIDPLIYAISPEKAAIKISHLLTMSSGFKWNEFTSYDIFNEWILSENQVQYLLDKPLTKLPGQYFNYNTAAAHLLSFILTKSTGISTHDFAMEHLFEPLGIDEIEWLVDKQGFNYGGHGLKITSNDMVKIGQLILNNGVFQGDTIISQDYLAQSIQSKISTHGVNDFAPNYGYCWWIGQNENGNFPFANGYGGQFIVVEPCLNLIVVTTNKWSGVGAAVSYDQWYKTLDLIINKILPCFS